MGIPSGGDSGYIPSDTPVKKIEKSNKFTKKPFNYLIKIGKFPDDLKTGKYGFIIIYCSAKLKIKIHQ